MTKLMDEAIAYLRQLDPAEQDELARNILEDSLVDAGEADRRRIAELLVQSEADFTAGRFTEDGDSFWAARLARARRLTR